MTISLTLTDSTAAVTESTQVPSLNLADSTATLTDGSENPSLSLADSLASVTEGSTNPSLTLGDSIISLYESGSIIYMGLWNSTTNYTPGNVVSLVAGGNLYVAIANNFNQTPPNATYWQLFLAGGSAVSSVFGRAGAVVAVSGDYSLSQIGTVSLSSPSNGQVLQYNGTSWVNATIVSGVTSVFGRTGAVTAQVGDYSSFYGQLGAANTWTSNNIFNGGCNFNVGWSGVSSNSIYGSLIATGANTQALFSTGTVVTPTTSNPSFYLGSRVATPTIAVANWYDGTNSPFIWSSNYNGGNPTLASFKNTLDDGVGNMSIVGAFTGHAGSAFTTSNNTALTITDNQGAPDSSPVFAITNSGGGNIKFIPSNISGGYNFIVSASDSTMFFFSSAQNNGVLSIVPWDTTYRGLKLYASASAPTIQNASTVCSIFTGNGAYASTAVYAAGDVLQGVHNSGGFQSTSYYISSLATIPASTAGWYRIAHFGPLVFNSGSGGGTGTATFTIADMAGSEHSLTTFRVSVCYGNNPTITILNRSYYQSDGMVRRIRVLTGATYDGCAVEVYCNNTNVGGVNVYFTMSDNTGNFSSSTNSTGFVPDQFTAGSIPTSFFTTEWDFDFNTNTETVLGVVSSLATNSGVVLGRGGGLNFFNAGNYFNFSATSSTNLGISYNGTNLINFSSGGLISYGTLSGGNVTVKNGTSEADIYFGPNDSYMYSNSGIAFGIFSTANGNLFTVAFPSGNGTFKGSVSASSFSGSGSGLTSVPWASLTGVPSLVNSFNGRTGAVAPAVGDYSTWYGQLAASNTWTSTNIFSNGIVSIGNNTLANGATCSLNTAAGQYRELAFQTAGTNRWIIYANNNAETGSNTGSDFDIGAYADNGTGLYSVLSSVRSTGALYSKNNTLDNGAGAATFVGAISASNFSGSSSGTNTGDQNLAPYALLSGATFTGLVTNTSNYIREYYGACGNYSTVATNTWGGPIWGIDTPYTGGIGAANWSPSGVYGIAWQRATSTNANANIGEGLYVYQNGVLEGGIGTSGIYSAHTIIAGGAISGSNLSGTNTGDQNLSGYALLSGATFTGTIFAPTFQISSSVVLKQDITPLEDTSILDKMNFYSYRLKANPDKLHFGLIAEELAEISSDLVGYDKDGKPFSINMLELIPLLAKRIETLTKEVAVLRAAK